MLIYNTLEIMRVYLNYECINYPLKNTYQNKQEYVLIIVPLQLMFKKEDSFKDEIFN